MKTVKQSYMLMAMALFLGLSQVSCQENSKDKKENSIQGNKMTAMSEKFPEAQPNNVWKDKMTDIEYNVMVEKGTEPPFNNPYHDNHKKGTYVSAATGEPLFSSEDKFDSGTGWPSFTKPLTEDAVIWVKDNSMGMSRDEIIETSTGLHLGHVFNDGPQPSGLRYCMNSAALKFIPADETEKSDQ